jgi:hypothetical protein
VRPGKLSLPVFRAGGELSLGFAIGRLLFAHKKIWHDRDLMCGAVRRSSVAGRQWTTLIIE